MVEEARKISIWRRARWLAPILAVGLTGLSALLGQSAQSQVLAQPDQVITFIVDEDLPYGITQGAVDAVAETQGFSYEPFTVMVVGRELTWDEYQHGELPEGVDVMLSVGIDESDVDLALADATRVSVAKIANDEDWMPHHRLASDIRETYINNLTQGHGASAVVGAAKTASSGAFDGETRSPVFWVSLAALPLLAGILIMVLWVRDLGRERKRKRSFSRARLNLARVVLELDLLDARVMIAGAELDRAQDKKARDIAQSVKRQLDGELADIRRDSLTLAHHEQILTREILNGQAYVHERRKPLEPLTLDEFAAETDALHRRTSALVAASSLRVGHTGGGNILGQVALASTLAVDDILKRTDHVTAREAKTLERQRGNLLALVHEAESAFGREIGPDTVVAHSNLMQRWRKAEQSLTKTLAKLEGSNRPPMERSDSQAIARRVKERIRIATGGQLDSLDELRASLNITPLQSRTPAEQAERTLFLIEAIDHSDSAAEPSKRAARRARDRSDEPAGLSLAAVGVPVVIALVAGWVAAATLDGGDTGYGKTLTGDKPLAALSILGDPGLLPELAATPTDHPRNIDTLTLEYVREKMASGARWGDVALLPEDVELVVTLLSIDDFVDARPMKDSDNRLEIDYLDVIDAYPRIKADVAAEYPDVIDPRTDDVRAGYAIQPLWIDADGRYGAGLPLTGELSSGVDSRLGAYYFEASEILMMDPTDDLGTMDAGWVVASQMLDLGRQLEYNNQRKESLGAGTMFWMVAISVWTGGQALVIAGWSLVEVLRGGAGTSSARRQLRGLRDQLRKLALGLDLSTLDAVAVLGSADGHDGRAAEADQQIYETMLFTAWREVQELESLPRRMQRGSEWRARVARMRTVITSLAERDTAVAKRALEMIRTYD